MLESESSECMQKKRPARPRPVNPGEPLVGPGAGRSAPELAVERPALKTARTATARPNLFQPPFGPCIMGHIGLFVQNANLAMLEAINPRQNAEIRASRR